MAPSPIPSPSPPPVIQKAATSIDPVHNVDLAIWDTWVNAREADAQQSASINGQGIRWLRAGSALQLSSVGRQQAAADAIDIYRMLRNQDTSGLASVAEALSLQSVMAVIIYNRTGGSEGSLDFFLLGVIGQQPGTYKSLAELPNLNPASIFGGLGARLMAGDLDGFALGSFFSGAIRSVAYSIVYDRDADTISDDLWVSAGGVRNQEFANFTDSRGMGYSRMLFMLNVSAPEYSRMLNGEEATPPGLKGYLRILNPNVQNLVSPTILFPHVLDYFEVLSGR